jgi:hypothetical protein
VRDEHFGPERSSEEIKEFLADARQVIAAHDQVCREAAALAKELTEARAGIETLTRMVTALEARRNKNGEAMAALRPDIERIGRRMAQIEKALLP